MISGILATVSPEIRGCEFPEGFREPRRGVGEVSEFQTWDPGNSINFTNVVLREYVNILVSGWGNVLRQ